MFNLGHDIEGNNVSYDLLLYYLGQVELYPSFYFFHNNFVEKFPNRTQTV